MSWLQAVPVAMACLIAFWGPGLLLARTAGIRGLNQVAIAPAATAGLLGCLSVLTSAVGIGWSWLSATVATGVTVLAVVLVRRARSASPLEAVPRRGGRPGLLSAAIVVGVLGQLVPILVAMGRPDRVLNAWDALFHLSAVQEARAAGDVTPMSLARLAAPGSDAVDFYPHAWHAVTALVPQWFGPLVSVNAASIVPVILATVVGMAALARAIFPDVPSAAPVTAVLAASGVVAPIGIALQPALIPNAFALSLVPGVLACVVEAFSGRKFSWPILGLAAVGITLAHPNAGLMLALLSLPWVVPALVSAARRLPVRWPGRIAAVAAVAAAVAAAAAVRTSSTAQVVMAIHQKPPQPYTELAGRLLTGNLGEWSVYPIVATVLAILGGIMAVRRRRGTAFVVAVAVAVALYASAASPIDAVSGLTRLWYTETRRIAPVLGMLLVPLAALAVIRTAHAATRRVQLPARLSVESGQRVLGALFIALAVGLGPLTLNALADDSFSQSIPDRPGAFDRVPYLSEAEEDMIRDVGERLNPDELLLGSSFSGAGHLAALTDQRVNQPYHTTALTSEAVYVSDHLADLGVDPRVCAAVRSLGAHAVYVDPYPLHSTYWQDAAAGKFTTPPREGVVLARGGATAIYSLDECY